MPDTVVWIMRSSEPTRATEINFSAAYLEIPATYLVPPGSPLNTIADVDCDGVRIAVSARSAYDLYLTRTLQRAKLMHADGIEASYELFASQKLDALAGLLPRLVTDIERMPDARIIDGQFTAIQQSIGTPVARKTGAQYLRAFVEEAKSTGLVATVIAQNNVRGVSVAPPAAG